ncbi:MAG: hypothetical protein ACRD0P_35915 [Stackebrandtia sp.]
MRASWTCGLSRQGAGLLDRARNAGVVRDDVTAAEVMALVAGASPRYNMPTRNRVRTGRRISAGSSWTGSDLHAGEHASAGA